MTFGRVMSDSPSQTLGAVVEDARSSAGRRRARLAVLALAVVAGIAVRLHGMSSATMSHEEIYTPGIPLPYEISDPRPRFDLVNTVLSTIHNDSHPPGYYVFMLGWTRIFGSSLFSLRLPSVLCGVGSILLIFWLASEAGLPDAGLFAASIWAISPLAVFMEQFARPYAPLCFLGLLSSLLLVRTYTARRRRAAMAAYVLVALAGISVSFFFWPILLAQTLFTLLGPAQTPGRLAPQTRWQLFVIVFGSPFIGVAAYQSRRSSYLSARVGSELLSYFQNLYAWSPYYDSQSPYPAPIWLSQSLALAVVGLLGLGVWSLRGSGTLSAGDFAGPSKRLMRVAAAVAVASIGLLVLAGYKLELPDRRVAYRPMIVSALIPVVTLAIDELVRRWPTLLKPVSFPGAPLGPRQLIVVLGIVPVALVGLASLAVPLFSPRTTYAFGPYLFLLVCAGIAGISRRWLWRVPALAIVLLVGATGLAHDRPPPGNYAGLVRLAEVEARPDDLWFVWRSYWVTPLFYHLKAEDHRLVGDNDYERALRERPQARVWLFGLAGAPPPDEATLALHGYRHVHRIEIAGIYFDLYVPPSS